MFDGARRVLQEAIAQHACPAAVVEVGTPTQPLWTEAFGGLTYDEGAERASTETMFDLASLTKVLVTASIVMQRVERGAMLLDDRLASHMPRWQGEERSGVTIRDLLAHCSGLPAYRDIYARERDEAGFTAAIADLPLEYVPRSRSLYSDLDFMLLGFALGGSARLPGSALALFTQMGVVDPLQFTPRGQWTRRIAPTGHSIRRGRLLAGEVNDDNAWALGGVAGHAGLFGTAPAVGTVARHLLQVLDGRLGVVRRGTLEEFVTKRSGIPGSSRALGWDTMLPTSSCGTRMSPRAFGHTGYTGTSLWIDPGEGVYVVLLSNRVHPTPMNNAFAAVRPVFHDAVMADFQDSDFRIHDGS